MSKKQKETAPPKEKGSPGNGQAIHAMPVASWIRKQTPSLRFSPYAFAKLSWCRERADTEVGFMGVTDPEDQWLVVDLFMPKQLCTVASVKFDDTALAVWMNEMAEKAPGCYHRVWCHTHPGDSAEPSGKDWQTFSTSFSKTPGAVMFILAGGSTGTCHVGYPDGTVFKTGWGLDYGVGFPAGDTTQWDKELKENVTEEVWQGYAGGNATGVSTGTLPDIAACTAEQWERAMGEPLTEEDKQWFEGLPYDKRAELIAEEEMFNEEVEMQDAREQDWSEYERWYTGGQRERGFIDHHGGLA